jgi:ubiquinone/menaquinone biosynthesis C-methylase UbiE
MLRAGIFYAGIAAWILAPVVALLGELEWAGALVALALGAHLAGRTWSRVSPVPMPYFMRGILHIPRGPQSPKRLNELLRPRSGEHILEIGPGIGVHALSVAAALLPDGVLDVLDVQQEMLDHLMRRAAGRGLTNIVPRLGDAQALPYADHVFDAAFLVSVLGEIPDVAAALLELRRVVKPVGRLLVGELAIDPDFIPLRALRAMAGNTGFVVERTAGPSFGYYAVLRPA